MPKTPDIIEYLTAALGHMLNLIEDHVDEDLSPREQQLFDEAAELYSQMKESPSVQTAVKKGVRRAS